MKRDEVIRLLTDGVQSLLNEDRFKEFLAFRARFYHYSWPNCLLILVQQPDATWVAGYKKWQELGRQVKQGEKGIAILAPLIKNVAVGQPDENDQADQRTIKTLVGFRVVHVFDVSQTEGEELPEPPKPRLLTGEDNGLVEAIKGFVERDGWTVRMEPAEYCPQANGQCVHGEKLIRIKPDLELLQQAKTMAHETAHALLHAEPDAPRDVLEVEAESVAFVVMALSGHDTSEYSFPYVAHWLAQGGRTDIKSLTTRLEMILKTADDILSGIAPTE